MMVTFLSLGSSGCQEEAAASRQETEPTAETSKMPAQKGIQENRGMAYTIITMKIDDPEKYAEYRRQSRPIFAAAGGHLEREFEIVAPPKGTIVDLGNPNRLLVLYYDTQDGDEKLLSDPEYQRVRKIMDEATSDVRVITGTSAHFEASESPEDGRFYLMKLSYYKDNTDGRMDELMRLSEDIKPYQFYTERMIVPDAAFGFDAPSEVAIHFHDEADQNVALQQDESLMQAIGSYNERFLEKYAYLGLKML